MTQQDIDNKLLAIIQKHFPSLPLDDRYTDWGKWLTFANAVYEAGRAKLPLTENQIDDMLAEANRGYCIDRSDYHKAVRDTESAHHIGE